MDRSVHERAINKNANQIHGHSIIKYRECLKNHAASIGGNATDGYGEFMPSTGENGTLDSFKCSACNCHRNSHRKEIKGDLISSLSIPHNMIMPIGYHHEGMKKKRRRSRTKFSGEQKEKMLAFAERVGWKLQKQRRVLCSSCAKRLGVKRRVLKVWMHNNMHHILLRSLLCH